MTAPRTSPLTEEEARELMREVVHTSRRFQERCSDDDHDGSCDVVTEYGAELILRVDSEARADLDDAVRLLRNAQCPAMAIGRAGPDWYRDRAALLARHPTPSTPTTTEET